jgi:hypothetical protein
MCQILIIQDNLYVQRQIRCIYSIIKSKYYQLELGDKIDIKFQDEKHRIVLIQAALFRQLRSLSYKWNNG